MNDEKRIARILLILIVFEMCINIKLVNQIIGLLATILTVYLIIIHYDLSDQIKNIIYKIKRVLLNE